MKNHNLAKILITMTLISSMSVALTSCKGNANKTGGAAPENQTISQPQPGTTTKEHLTALGKITSKLDKLNFDEFRNQTEKGFTHIAKAIKGLKNKNEVLPADVAKDVMELENTLPKIKEAKTPDELIKYEETAFKSTSSALSKINNKINNPQIKTNVDIRLAEVDKGAIHLNQQNYKKETKRLFNEIHTVINELHKSLK